MLTKKQKIFSFITIAFMAFFYAVILGSFAPKLPSLLQNYLASVSEGKTIHCEDFVSGDLPDYCIVANAKGATINAYFKFFLAFICGGLNPLIGNLSDRIGRKPILMCFLLIPVFSYISLYIYLNYVSWFIWVFMVIYSSTISFDLMAILNAFIADLSKTEEISKNMSLFAGINSIPLVAGPVISLLPTNLIIFILCPLTIIVDLCTLFLPSHSEYSNQSNKTIQREISGISILLMDEEELKNNIRSELLEDQLHLTISTPVETVCILDGSPLPSEVIINNTMNQNNDTINTNTDEMNKKNNMNSINENLIPNNENKEKKPWYSCMKNMFRSKSFAIIRHYIKKENYSLVYLSLIVLFISIGFGIAMTGILFFLQVKLNMVDSERSILMFVMGISTILFNGLLFMPIHKVMSIPMILIISMSIATPLFVALLTIPNKIAVYIIDFFYNGCLMLYILSANVYIGEKINPLYQGTIQGFISCCRILGCGIGTLLIALFYQPLLLKGGIYQYVIFMVAVLCFIISIILSIILYINQRKILKQQEEPLNKPLFVSKSIIENKEAVVVSTQL